MNKGYQQLEKCPVRDIMKVANPQKSIQGKNVLVYISGYLLTYFLIDISETCIATFHKEFLLEDTELLVLEWIRSKNYRISGCLKIPTMAFSNFCMKF